MSSILSLKIRVLPVLAGDDAPACGSATVAGHRVIVVIRGCPIVCQFLACQYIPKSDEHDLPLNADIRIAGMVAVDHSPVSLFRVERPYKKVFANLDLCGPKNRLDIQKLRSREHISALHAYDFARAECLCGKQAPAVNQTLSYNGFRRNVGKHFSEHLPRIILPSNVRVGLESILGETFAGGEVWKRPRRYSVEADRSAAGGVHPE
jgi:hypothetical protein